MPKGFVSEPGGLMAVLGEQDAYPNAVQAANITASGILSHASAMAGGERIYLPDWTLSDRQPLNIELDNDLQPAWKNETAIL